MKQSAGVVVSWTGQEVKVQRGVVLCADEKMEEKDASTDLAPEKVDPLDAVSVPLLISLTFVTGGNRRLITFSRT
ncbi:DNA-binding protein [Klebsiella pneumoniae]|nr:DNA-binding protein [Klebsiella pneumoniae]